jgi:hypothetical protein
MKKNLAFLVATAGFFVAVQQAQSAQVSLADWCVNLNGDIATACNGAGSGGASGTGSISLASFDQTLEPGSNTLGTVTVTLGAGSGQYVAFYADYDVDFATKGSFADSGSIHGSLPANTTYELSDPNTSNIFTDFAGNSLSNTNTVGTPGLPPNECCDVAFALDFGSLNVPAGGGTVTFAITSTAPSSGFYIQQTNQYTGDSIYLQGTVNLSMSGGGGGTGTPEPPTFFLGLSLIGVALAWNRRRSA